jgi:transcriptional regulator with PAS, ATPase and Fis domain
LGVIVLNKDGYLEQANEEASKQLSICKADEKIKIDIEFTGDSLLDNEEYKVVIGKKTFQVIGKLIDFTTTINEKSTILLFNNIKKVKSEIYNLTNVNQHQTVNNIIGNTNEIQQLKEKIIKIANSSSTVLIVGESGTGKDLVARAIHSESNRKNNPFVSINCGAIPDTLLESELFGYVKGAFTGADPRGKIGKFEIANKGIIFLDEIGDMPLYLQVKLLRVLQERKISRIGSNQIIDIDVRVIAATNRDLAQLIKENKFRDDLYYRLNVIPIHVPALRERKADIEPLIKNLLMKYCRLFGRNHVDMDKETLAILVKYPWPGNVRELENTIEFMINMVGTDDVITKEYLPENILRVDNGRQVENVLQESTIMSLREVERQYIQQALKIYGSDTDGKLMAARKLGISLATLYRRIDGEKY